METIKLEGVIIGDKPFKENSKILDIIAKEKGVISVISKGCKKLKSELRSASEKFCYASFNIIYKEGKLSTLVSADIINSFKNIKKDIEKISYVNFISDLTNQVIKHSYNESIFDIYIGALLKIEEGFSPSLITNILELKYLDFLGISPVFDCCSVCGKESVVTLSSYKGGFVCNEHKEDEYIVSTKTIKIIRMLKYVDISKISKLDVSDVVKKEINTFIDEYYDRYSGLYLKSKDFLKNIVKL